MRLVWHIVKKDFRRLWAPLSAWALLLAARGEVGVRVLRGDGMAGDGMFYFRIANTTLLWLDAVVCVLLIAALVHEDALVGSRTFWVTRPIGGGRLLAAKLVGAALMFGAVPMVVAVRWWVACGYGGAEMARAALAVADAQAGIVFGALTLAALTKTMSQFLGWALGLGGAAIGWGLAATAIAELTHPEVTRGVIETRGVLMMGALLVGGASVIGAQFFTRRREWAIRVAVATVGLLAGIQASGWDFSKGWARVAESEEKEEEKLELALRAGESVRRAGFGVWIKRVEWSEGECRVSLVESRPDWTGYGWWRPSVASLFERGNGLATEFSLVNREQGEAVKVRGNRSSRSLLVGTQEIAWLTLKCTVPRDAAERETGAWPRWLEGATLAVVRYHEEARFDREVKVERFGVPTEGAAAK